MKWQKNQITAKKMIFWNFKNNEKQGFKPKTLVNEGFSPLLGNWVYTKFIIDGYLWQI
jgi:hypothetical protein